MVAAAKATALSFLGVGLESTPMTGVAPTFYIPVTKIEPIDDQRWLDDLGWRGSMVTEYDEIAGVVSTELGLGGDVYADSIGWLVAGILGDVTVTGASAPFTHACSTLNSSDGQPPSYSYTDYYGRTDASPARRYAGQKVSELTLKADAEGMFTWEGKTVGIGSAIVAKPTSAFTTITPEPAWEGVVTIGGSAKAYIESFETHITRQLSPVFNIDGTDAPYEIFSGKLAVSGKLVAIMEDDTELNRYTGAAKATTSLDIDYTHGAGAALVEVKQHMTKVQYVSPTKITRGKEYVEVEIEFKAIANTTDAGASGGYSPLKVTLQNALPSGTYK